MELREQEYEGKIVRILSKDIKGDSSVYSGLTKIKGISWSLSNVICKKLKIDKSKKIESLTKEEIDKIIKFMEDPKIPEFLKNRKKDLETGENRHVIGSNLELVKEFDIKRLKKIRSYKGLRHSAGLPLRGQKTQSHFRKNRAKGVGIKKKKKPSNKP